MNSKIEYPEQTLVAILYITKEWIKDLKLIEDTLLKAKITDPNDN